MMVKDVVKLLLFLMWAQNNYAFTISHFWRKIYQSKFPFIKKGFNYIGLNEESEMTLSCQLGLAIKGTSPLINFLDAIGFWNLIYIPGLIGFLIESSQ